MIRPAAARAALCAFGILGLGLRPACALPHQSIGAGARFPVTLAGQQYPQHRIALHGVLVGLDPAAHRVDISHAGPLAMFWAPALHHCKVAPGLDLTALHAGQPVDFVLTRGAGGQYFISALSIAA
jgi:hypothetical protein